ncbi:ADP-ribose glycohydrolase MACROD1 [Genypterus blacodes]|uniref:ADP-ribose glycohydrolase MACROD1 n=1 Tax=Genypterus blacodes TaxID=154954 RepID=UPI003F76D098
MAFKISALFPRSRVLHLTGPFSRFQSPGVRFTHTLIPGSPPVPRKLATSPLGYINATHRAGKFSTSSAAFWKSSQGRKDSSSARGRRGWLGGVILGAALGVSTAAVVQTLQTGTLTTMALNVDLNSGQGDWKKTKDVLLSLSVEERRKNYRTPKFVPLDDISVWSSTAVGSKQSRYPRNEKLDHKIAVYSGDITQLEIDAIVNAANKTLLGGGGVDGAIHRAAGPLLKKECASLHGCETGQAKITCGYGLPPKYVVHTVGPIVTGGVGEKERKALRSCYRRSLEVATRNAARSVAFPCISTGIYGYPPEQAVHEALATVREYLDEHHEKLDRVIFCVFLPTDKELYLQNLPLYFPGEVTVRSKL